MIGLKALAATLSVSAPIQFSGSFSKTAAPSGGYVTSDTITLTVPPGNSGQLTITYGATVGTVSGIEYNKNGAGFVAWTDGASVTFANSDTLAIRAGGGGGGAITAGESQAFTLIDNTRSVTSSTYTLTAS